MQQTHSVMENLEQRVLLSAAVMKVLFDDQFNGNKVNTTAWQMPTWRFNGDGTYFGETQLRCSQNAPISKESGGAVHLLLDTYNPTQLSGFPSIYGSQMTLKKIFSVGTGISFTWRAKLNAKIAPGCVGGLFIYNADPHNEVDFELISNKLAKVNTNVYANQPLGVGTPQLVSLPAGKATDYHIYTTNIYPDRVEWYIDNKLVRTENNLLPTGPLQAYINMWAPDASWPLAYSSSLKLATSSKQNKEYSMDVDYVTVKSITPAFSVTSIAPPSLDKTTVAKGDIITASDSITGAGNGTVKYVWMVKNPNGATSQVGGAKTATMKNGTAFVSSFTSLPTNVNGNYTAWVKVTIPKALNGKAAQYSVVPITATVNLATPALATQGDTVTANGRINGIGNRTVTYVWWVDAPFGLTSRDPLTVTMTNGVAVIPDFTLPSLYVVGQYSAWIDITNPDGTHVISDTITYTVQEPTGTVTSVTSSLVVAGQVITSHDNTEIGIAVTQNDIITVCGSIAGTGYANLKYRWKVQDPEGNSTVISGPLTVNMVNGSAVIPSFTWQSPSILGTHFFWVDVTNPDGTGSMSMPMAFTVQSPITVNSVTANLITPSPVAQGSLATVGGSITGVGDGEISYEWMFTDPNGVTAPFSIPITVDMLGGSAILHHTTLPASIIGDYKAWMNIITTNSVTPQITYSVQAAQPGIYIDYVPALGDGNMVLGHVVGIDLSQYSGVAAYINVNGNWWPKPYFISPLTSIKSDGTWTCSVTTGGIDWTDGTLVRVYLIPVGFTVPINVGALDSSLDGLMYAEVSRVP